MDSIRFVNHFYYNKVYNNNNCQQNITNNSSELSNVYLLYYECIDNLPPYVLGE